MAHSLLSVPLNLGLLDPVETAAAAEQAYRRGDVALNAAEGFVRQVIGWREYVWHLYWHLGPDYRARNAMRATRALPPWFADLDASSVEAACLRTALDGVHERGWTHHIQRLMVLGNHALQRGYDPDAMTEWFQTTFVDGFDWVMPVNVVGMSQHADGGLIATKPYSSGGAYINRMSDHCKGCAYDPKRRTGADACPFTAGYWAWVHRHRERLARTRGPPAPWPRCTASATSTRSWRPSAPAARSDQDRPPDPPTTASDSSSAASGRRSLRRTACGAQAPLMVTSWMTRLTPAARIGSQSTSAPTSATSSSMRCSVEAIVNSRTGAPTVPLAISIPDAPVEKSPLIGLTPECRPDTDCTSSPSSTSAMSAAWSRVPGQRAAGRGSRRPACRRTRRAWRCRSTPCRRGAPSSSSARTAAARRRR